MEIWEAGPGGVIEAPAIAVGGTLAPVSGPGAAVFVARGAYLPAMEHPCPFVHGDVYAQSPPASSYGTVDDIGAGGVVASTYDFDPDGAPMSIIQLTRVLRMKAQTRQRLRLDLSISGFVEDETTTALSVEVGVDVCVRTRSQLSSTGYAYMFHYSLPQPSRLRYQLGGPNTLSVEAPTWLRYALVLSVNAFSIRPDGDHGIYGLNPGTVTIAFSGG